MFFLARLKISITYPEIQENKFSERTASYEQWYNQHCAALLNRSAIFAGNRSAQLYLSTMDTESGFCFTHEMSELGSSTLTMFQNKAFCDGFINESLKVNSLKNLCFKLNKEKWP